jgi:hypothetical protein
MNACDYSKSLIPTLISAPSISEKFQKNKNTDADVAANNARKVNQKYFSSIFVYFYMQA